MEENPKDASNYNKSGVRPRKIAPTNGASGNTNSSPIPIVVAIIGNTGDETIFAGYGRS